MHIPRFAETLGQTGPSLAKGNPGSQGRESPHVVAWRRHHMSPLLLPVIFAAGVCSGQGPVADAWPERLEPAPRHLFAEAPSRGAPAVAPSSELPQSAGETLPGT